MEAQVLETDDPCIERIRHCFFEIRHFVSHTHVQVKKCGRSKFLPIALLLTHPHLKRVVQIISTNHSFTDQCLAPQR
jgi:hypothetical protein